jgi:hypothetical protein
MAYRGHKGYESEEERSDYDDPAYDPNLESPYVNEDLPPALLRPNDPLFTYTPPTTSTPAGVDYRRNLPHKKVDYRDPSIYANVAPTFPDAPGALELYSTVDPTKTRRGREEEAKKKLISGSQFVVEPLFGTFNNPRENLYNTPAYAPPPRPSSTTKPNIGGSTRRRRFLKTKHRRFLKTKHRKTKHKKRSVKRKSIKRTKRCRT